jgi:imidazolonepropionase-like amidohydrolase
MPASWIPIAEAVLEPHRQSFQHALDAGVFFAAGTDGFGDLISEMLLFTSYGMSNYRALQAATRDAALIMEEKPQFGTLEPGKVADVIAVEGDPCEDLNVLRSVLLVMMGGRLVRRRGMELPRRQPALA